MIGESQNPTHEVYIDGFGLEGNIIPYNTGVDLGNKINSIREQLTTGQDYIKYLNEKSTPLEFKTILTEPMVEEGYEKLLMKVVNKAKKTPVKIMFNGHSFMGMVLEFSISFPPEAYREYDWLIVESKPFKPKSKKFNTFNYKKTNTPTKDAPVITFPPSIEALLKCNPVYNCGKYGVSCVTSWQKYLTSKGYYGSKGYKIDGQFCTYTKSETERWQKDNKVKKTGKVDKATKLKIMELSSTVTGLARPKSPLVKIGQTGVPISGTTMSASEKKKALQNYLNLFS